MKKKSDTKLLVIGLVVLALLGVGLSPRREQFLHLATVLVNSLLNAANHAGTLK